VLYHFCLPDRTSVTKENAVAVTIAHSVSVHNLGRINMANLAQIVEQLKTEAERLTQQLRIISGALAAFGTTSGKRARVRKLSAAGRKSIAAAQRARWAKIRNAKQNIVTMPKRRTMSAAARKKIAAAQRARWAKVRAQSKAA
jgi:hypothetical protein